MIVAIIFIGLAGQIRGGIIGAVAAKLPPQSGTSSSISPTSWGHNDDIPIMGGDHFRDRGATSRLGVFRRRSKRNRRRSRRDDDITTDENGGNAHDDDDDVPHLRHDDFDDYDGWPHYEYDPRLTRRKSKRNNHHHPFDSFRHWALETSGVHIPRINLHLNPITIFKIRKSWHSIIPGAIIRAGADFESKGVWRLRGCVEDKLIGGRFTIKNMKHAEDVDDDRAVLLEYSKSWLFAGAGKLLDGEVFLLTSIVTKKHWRTISDLSNEQDRWVLVSIYVQRMI